VLQDCPAGQKCVWLPPEQGEVETVCVPVDCDGHDAGELCERDGMTGIDDCSATTFCATPLFGSGTGYCTDFCLPNSSAFACADPTKICVGSASLGEYGCFPSCDPLVDACPPMTACMPTFPGFVDQFACQPAAADQTATTGEPCYGPIEGCPPGGACYQCASGYACIEPLAYGPGCYEESGCCTEYCDLGGGRCSNPLHECRPFPGEAMAPVGQCGIPEDFDWCDGAFVPPPGLCPPPDAEPNFPWCSSYDDSACPGDAVHLGGGHCWCVDECETVDECPVPATGTGTPACDAKFGGCTVLCADDSECPNGMDCFSVDGALRCLWHPDAG
jgi:hypothetical protein